MACGWITIVFLSLYQTGFLLANLTPNCTPQELNVKPEENRVVHQEIVSGDHNTSTTLFMQSRHDFKGISVLVNNKDITPTWLSPQYCFLDDTEWVKIGVGVTDKQISAPYGHVTVTTDTCKWECDIATIRVPTRPVILTLLAHGSSTWQRFPSPQCYNTTDSDWGSKTDFICTPKADSKPTIRTGSVFLGLLVIMAVVVVTVPLQPSRAQHTHTFGHHHTLQTTPSLYSTTCGSP
ncbi:uncharacterized protein LOC135103640 isoform X2 [Scylla paramamosain]|uniref:uncharacterized protein LOC135103640 isoform X2 n=1 Tax=Scylla paramamosain TaxID=85552 RepID=UPI003082862A